MANKKTKPTKETVKAEKSDEVLTEVSLKKNKKAAKAEETKKVDQKKAKKTKKVEKVKRNRGKEVVSELKKVNWPSFKKACKQTGTVLAVVSVFMLAVLGIDSLVAWILSLITKI
ncbi:MAG: preprotein translocase subunit SecE [Clostridiales bacterium]|nr:preprotein translocase subunit SecE [Clostridiales bacterium]